MSGWDLGIYVAAAVLIVAPLGVFSSYLREITRRLREDDWGAPPPTPLFRTGRYTQEEKEDR
ncbi:MAG: hypothetical protein WAQ32_07350 [Dethiobacteria bacterium]|jgi:hypothetical protein|nr:hypothetical protein [Bacillota bacterium]NMD32386.1 hypothetical protein [Bacillota bacterium]HOB29236.1 hypothetical protein [Bacillota bacterium]HPZ41848.1 hypothetical protein [Bacillota bacterium]HQD52712.1 hypothetical protein [Bacillota bacterium]